MNDSTLLAFKSGIRMQWEEAQSCHVLLYPEGMVTLNESAHAILKHVDGTKSFSDIVAAVESEFSGEGMRDDVLEFFGAFVERGFLVHA